MKKFSSLLARLLLCISSTSLMIAILLSVEPSKDNLNVSFVVLLLLWTALYNFQLSVHHVLRRKEEKRYIKSVAAIIASGIVLTVMFSALGDFSLFDMLLVVSLVTLGLFYMRRTWPSR